jgi:hypothetical protein
MKHVFFGLTTILVLAIGNFSVRALDSSMASTQLDAPRTVDASSRQQTPHGDVASRASCREVEVAIDEGYGVSSHVTRRECAPAR